MFDDVCEKDRVRNARVERHRFWADDRARCFAAASTDPFGDLVSAAWEIDREDAASGGQHCDWDDPCAGTDIDDESAGGDVFEEQLELSPSHRAIGLREEVAMWRSVPPVDGFEVSALG
jgi:hypothetical protein